MIKRKSCLRRKLALLAMTSFSTPMLCIGAPQETLLPPQRIPVSGTLIKVLVADVNGDGFDDIVTLSSNSSSAVNGLGIDVYLNEGKTRSASESVKFNKTPIPLTSHANADATAAGLKLTSGGDLVVTDLDGDGKLDLLATNSATGEIFVLWNQGNNSDFPYKFVPDAAFPTDPSMTFYSPLAQVGFGGPGAGNGALGTPIYVTAANLGDGTGRKSIIAYHGSLQPDASSKEKAPFNQRNYEAMAVIYPATGTTRGFAPATQRMNWPGCDLAFGTSCTNLKGATWADGMPGATSLYNFRAANGVSLAFADAASEILQPDGFVTYAGVDNYKPAVLRPNASEGLQVLEGHGANGSDAVWLEGAKGMNEFVHDNGLKLMKRRTYLNSVEGTERAGGGTFATMSTGQKALISAGGMDVYYDPGNSGTAVKQPIPDYLNRNAQIGSWVNWVQMNSGAALLSLSDDCRTPDPCTTDGGWYHPPLDGSAPPLAHWGATSTLVMMQFAKEKSTPSGQQFEPFFTDIDDPGFQALSILGGSTGKPFATSGHFASPSEEALLLVDHRDGDPLDPLSLYTHLALYRPDLAKTYTSPIPKLSGLVVGEFIKGGLTDIGLSLPMGKKSAVLVGFSLGVSQDDAIRYAVVRIRKTYPVVAPGPIVGVFPVGKAEMVKGIAKDGTDREGITVPGLASLPIGQYFVEVRNATQSASMELDITNPSGIVSTNYDWSAGSECGLQPDTKTGDLWPRQIAVTVSDFAGDKMDLIRWIRDDGTTVDLPASEYATYSSSDSTVTLIVPQDGRLEDGTWRPYIRSEGAWLPVGRSWKVSRDSSTVLSCAKQTQFINDEAYAQCTTKDYFLDPAQYKVWPNLVNGLFRFSGQGFSRIKSAMLRQGNKRIPDLSLENVSDNEIRVNFGDLRDTLTPDVDIDIYFYTESSDTVLAYGVPASGGREAWRKARKGTCIPQMPQITGVLNTGSGEDGTFMPGDTVKVSGKNILYPIPSATKYLIKGGDGSIYMLENPRLPDDWYTHSYSNEDMVLYFTVPDDLSKARLTAPSDMAMTPNLPESFGHPQFPLGPPGLIVAGSGALATTGISDAALSFLHASPAAPLVLVGAGGLAVTGGSIYLGVQNTTWAYEKIAVVLGKSIPSPTPDFNRPGKPADNQPNPQQLYLAIFVSQPMAYQNVMTGPVDAVVFKASSAQEANAKAPVAVGAYMATYRGQIGTVDYFSDSTQELPYEYSAGITSLHSFGSADGIGPDTDLRSSIPIFRSQFPVLKYCNGKGWSGVEIGETDPNALSPPSYTDNRLVSFAWRRHVIANNYPPNGCATYEEVVGDMINQTPATYNLGIKNNFTGL